MPEYSFCNDKTGEVIDLFFTMNEKKEHIDSDGYKWRRLYSVPQTSIDTKINPFSERDFVNKTGNKRGTVGEVMDLSAELSAKREESTGKEDPVKRKLFNDYEKKTKKKHLKDKPKVIETSKVRIDL